MAPRKLNFIVPYPKGGGSDNRVRLLTKHLATKIGREINVINISVKGGEDGHEAIAAAEPDGHTIGMISLEILMLCRIGLTEVTWKDYTPLALSFAEPAGVIVHADSGFKKLADVLDVAKKGHLIGSGSPDLSGWQFALVGLLHAAGIPQKNLRWIPTISGEQGVEKVLAGEADIAPVSLADALPFMHTNKIRMLANMDDRRHPLFKGIPTVKEATGLEWTNSMWRGIAGPKGMPKKSVEVLSEGLRAVAMDPTFKSESNNKGYTLDWRFTGDFAKFMEVEDGKIGTLMELLKP